MGKLVEVVPVPARRWVALATALLVALVVCWPVLAHPDRDGFPLSTYPMFSSRRTTTEPLSTVVGIDAGGAQHWLDPWLLNGTREVVQAAVVVSNEINAGEADRLCAEVAGRVYDRQSDRRADDASDDAAGDRLVGLEVVTVRYDAVGWFDGRRQPLERTVHATCPVPACRRPRRRRRLTVASPARLAPDPAGRAAGHSVGHSVGQSIGHAVGRAADRLVAPAPAARLGVLRLLVGGYATVYLLVRLPHLWSETRLPDYRWQPVGMLGPATLAAALAARGHVPGAGTGRRDRFHAGLALATDRPAVRPGRADQLQLRAQLGPHPAHRAPAGPAPADPRPGSGRRRLLARRPHPDLRDGQAAGTEQPAGGSRRAGSRRRDRGPASGRVATASRCASSPWSRC